MPIERIPKPAAGVDDHGDLSGLADDDHPQYSKATTSHTSNGKILMTGSTSRDIVESGASVDSSGSISTAGSDLTTGGGDVVTGPGLVDGRDVSVDGTKLDTVATNADVTGSGNVAAAGAIMDGDFSSNGIMVRTAAGSHVSRTVIAGAGVTVTNGSGVSGNPVIASPRSSIMTWAEGGSFSSVTKPLGFHNINNVSGTSLGIHRCSFSGDIRNITLAADIAAAIGNPRLGWIFYRATAINAAYGLFNFTSTTATIATAGVNRVTSIDFAAGDLSVLEGQYVSFTLFRSGGSAMTYSNTRAWITLTET